jgi:hypothetical protein
MAAPGQDAAQPSEGTAQDGQGQGQDRTSPEQYQSGVLSPDVFTNAPEELRPHLMEYVKTQVDPHLQERFSENADFRKTWEPFSQVEGLTEWEPEALGGLLEFADAVDVAADENHPQHQEAMEAVFETWQAMGEQFGLWDRLEDSDDSGEDGEGEEPEYMTREQFEQERQRWESEQQMSQNVEQAAEAIRGHVDALKLPGDPGSPERETAAKAIYSLMTPYLEDSSLSEEDLVKAAYQDYTAIRGNGQADLIEETEERQPGTTMRGGGASNEPEEVKSWAEADRLAKERLRAAGV